MKKYHILFFIFLVGVNTLVFGEAPELRIVMPNSWRRITQLSRGEEEILLGQYKFAVDDIRKTFAHLMTSPMTLPFARIFKQTVAGSDFYRVVLTSNGPDFSSPDCQFVQGLVYNDKLLCIGVYNCINDETRGTRRLYYYVYNSIDISVTSGGSIGVLLSSIKVPASYEYSHFSSERKGQYYGIPEAIYFLVDTLPEKVTINQWHDAGDFYPAAPFVLITASDCLVDREVPLRYGLQNAFDNDPATSYVENTENDLCGIHFEIRDPKIFNLQELALINGYAQNTALYYNNNRVKTMWYSLDGPYYLNQLMLIADSHTVYPVSCPEKLSYTKEPIIKKLPIRTDEDITYGLFSLIVRDIYPGNRYNDTCIAEFNLLYDEGWLFGAVE
jgi:hypothetical protein